MKKVAASILAFLLVFSLFACAGVQDSAGPAESAEASLVPAEQDSQPSSTEAATQTSGETSEAAEPGYYDPGIDVFAREPYQVVYMRTSNSEMAQSFSDSLLLWSERLNLEYSDYSANSDIDAFMVTLETLSDQGTDGFMLDIYEDQAGARAIEICNDKNIIWMTAISGLYEEDGKLAHPTVGFNNVTYGEQMMQWLVDYATASWDGFDVSKAGFIAPTNSSVSQISDRMVGSQQLWDQTYPELKSRFFVCDGVSGDFSANTAYDLVAATMSANPDVEYWLIASSIDAYAEGAARAAEQAEKDDQTVIIAVGGQSLINDWDAGYEGCWAAALFTAQPLYTECVINGLLAQLDGRAKAENLWPEWKGEGETYAQLLIPSQVLLKDNYQEYLEWVDAYTGMDISDYEYHGTVYSAKGTPPSQG